MVVKVAERREILRNAGKMMLALNGGTTCRTKKIPFYSKEYFELTALKEH